MNLKNEDKLKNIEDKLKDDESSTSELIEFIDELSYLDKQQQLFTKSISSNRKQRGNKCSIRDK